MTSDRVDSDVVPLAHESLAMTLGAGRASVPALLRTLNDLGLVRNRRGSIIIVDRNGLERLACGCYRKVREGFHRLLH
jgi:CRP-like cAMP-binding protein